MLYNESNASASLHKIALICGGPSGERGISLNSARSFLDHTHPLQIELSLFYLNLQGVYYQIDPAELYSNTPSDFDFKLTHKSTCLTEAEWIFRLQKMDLVFPLIHGPYGEDGTLQEILETHAIPYVGSSSSVCRNIFNKHRAQDLLAKHGFTVLPSLYIDSKTPEISSFWQERLLKRAVLKPTESGSSIGVVEVDSPAAALEALDQLWQQGFRQFLLEPYCEDVEFTICVLENKGTATALVPIEIHKLEKGIFDYRNKYLPSQQTRYYCPPRFPEETIALIRSEAQKLFTLLKLSDFTRIDGWVSKEGVVRFSDLNPISGMEQNSFLFQQAARIGLSHADLIEYILNQALSRYKKPPIARRPKTAERKQPVYVLMGGSTSERQVSLLSGTNVWLKLMQTSQYEPIPFLIDEQAKIWQLPYGFALHHTVEEMTEQCQGAPELLAKIHPLVNQIREQLHLSPISAMEVPKAMSWSAFLKRTQAAHAFVFLGLHGGIGEDGTLQKALEKKGIAFNGSRFQASRLCMDKHQTAKKIRSIHHPQILAMPQISFKPILFDSEKKIQHLWERATTSFQTDSLIVKPQKDGCSTGVARLSSWQELHLYLSLLQEAKRQAPAGLFSYHSSVIEMPNTLKQPFILEPFIETDKIHVLRDKLIHEKISGWSEMTIGVLEKNGCYQALNPSITVAASHVLSIEEKFQGGTGINITPPPEHILSEKACKLVQENACLAALALGIQGYARLDLFVECATGTIRVIEANTLPALTPSTVLYHQGLSVFPPIPPKNILTFIIEAGRLKKLSFNISGS